MDALDAVLGAIGGAALAIVAGPFVQKKRDEGMRKLTPEQAQAVADAMEAEFPELAKVKVAPAK